MLKASSRKRKVTNRVPPPAKKRTKAQQKKQQKQVQQNKENVSSGSTTVLRKADGLSLASSISLIRRRNSAASSSHSTLLQQPDENQNTVSNSSKTITRSSFKPDQEKLSKIRSFEAKFASSETSCLEKEPTAAISEQFSCSRNSILTENCFGQSVVYPDQFSPSESPNEWKAKNFVQSSVYNGEVSCSESVFDAVEIETVMSKLVRVEAASPSPCTFSDATPASPDYSDSEEYSISPFFSATSDGFQESAAHSSVLISSITQLEEIFLSWKDYAYANLPELPLSTTGLTESRTENDENKDFELSEDEDERTFQKFRARECRQAIFWDYLWDYVDTNLADAIGKQRILMINWIMEYTASHQLQWETLFLAANLMDRFLSKGTFRNESHLQILGVACMTLAIRLEENQPGNWYYLKAARGDVEVEKTAKYLACLSLVDRQLLRFWPSTIAVSLVILACQVLNQNDSYKLVME
ncbi:hypothetical protein KI387_016038, partial [Taxus chinensis]